MGYAQLAGKFIELAQKHSQVTPETLKAAVDKEDGPNPLEAMDLKELEIKPAKKEGEKWKEKHPLTFDKTLRMWKAVRANGFTSFAEN